jgi:hypothetical protein
VTAAVLTAGLLSFRKGNPMLGQKFMQARVIAQGLTVLVIVYGSYDKIFPKESILAAKFSEYANYARRQLGLKEHVRVEYPDKYAEAVVNKAKSEWSDVSVAATSVAIEASDAVSNVVDTEAAKQPEKVSWYSYFMGTSKPPPVTTTSTDSPVNDTKK